MELVPIKLEDIPCKNVGGKNKSKWRKAIEAFIESDAQAVEIKGVNNPKNARQSLSAAIAKWDYPCAALNRGERLFLVRRDK